MTKVRCQKGLSTLIRPKYLQHAIISPPNYKKGTEAIIQEINTEINTDHIFDDLLDGRDTQDENQRYKCCITPRG